jgi:intracellular sulfur oxidation DsrE/DsrF family protein
MKYFLFFIVASISITTGYSQKNKTKTGPVFDDFGAVFAIDDADLLLDVDKTYKVIFDVYTDAEKPEDMNPLINTVARFMNMHAQNGLPEEQMDLVVVLHGAALKNALTEKAFKKKFKTKHPNAELISALVEKDVKIYVCGQSMKSRGYGAKDISEDVKISLSALTALVKYQSEGFQIINFN